MILDEAAIRPAESWFGVPDGLPADAALDPRRTFRSTDATVALLDLPAGPGGRVSVPGIEHDSLGDTAGGEPALAGRRR